MNVKCTLAVLISALMWSSSAMAQQEEPEGEPAPPSDGVIPLRPFNPQRADNILLDEVIRSDTWWVQAQLGGALYDARRDLFVGRWSPSVQVGRRFDSIGFFGMVEFDQTFDFTLETESLRLLNMGVGVESLAFLGHVRSSFAVGTTVLLSNTTLDEAGELGWFIDIRPGSLRWGMGEEWAFELTPISVDIVAPITSGIPLVIYSYMTILSVEWAQ